MISEYETVYDTIKEVNGVLYISIDKKLATFAGFKKGMKVKILIKEIREIE